MPIFGYTVETIQMLMIPMLKTKKEGMYLKFREIDLTQNNQLFVYNFIFVFFP